RRAGATWVATTGAFLVLAAAALFVAVGWHRFSDTAKFTIVTAVMGSFLAAGVMLCPSLPATSSVLFHLGALLIPVDVAGLNIRLGFQWPIFIAVDGAVSTLAFVALSRVRSSELLRWAGALGAVTTCAGVGAATGVPAPVLVALLAVAWSLTRDHDDVAVAWGATAGLAPLVSAVLAV